MEQIRIPSDALVMVGDDSQFAGRPGFAQAREGAIVLQHHGTDAWFRNVSIERL